MSSVVCDGVEGPEVKIFREGEENENKNQTSETTGRRIISSKQVAIRWEPRNPEELSAKGKKVLFLQASLLNPNQVVLILNVDMWTFTTTKTRASGGVWAGGGTDMQFLI